MLTLDHIVVHIDGAAELTDLSAELKGAGIPFEPSWGKAAKGFKVANIWIGQQYFEIVDIYSPDNLWQPQWSARHANGDRGVYCIFFKTDENIYKLYNKFLGSGVQAAEPERTRFKWLFGLLEKKLPWQFMLLPKIPGTPVEIGIIQYDGGAEKKSRPYMVPNTEDVGLTGLSKARVYTEQHSEAQTYLETIRRLSSQDVALELSPKNPEQTAAAELLAVTTNNTLSSFKVANTTVVV